MNLHRIFQISKGLPPDSLHDTLFARKLSASPTETVTVSGYPCVLENSVEKPVVDYRIYGNTVQNSTPSPDNPVEIQSVGDLVTDGEYAGKYKIPVVASTENNVPKTTNIYLDEPLRKIGDYADVIDFERGGVERKIGKLVFTENEIFRNTTYNMSLFMLDMKGYLRKEEITSLSSHYQPQKNVTGYKLVADMRCTFYANSANLSSSVAYIRDSRFSTIDNFKAYLKEQYDAGTPVTVYYALAESRTENLTLPQLHTLNGMTIITTDTEIKPSDIEITYKVRK